MTKFWKKYLPYWPVIVTLGGVMISGIFWVNNVSGYDKRIGDLETEIKLLPRVQQRVEDIADFLGVPRHHE